MFPKSGQRISSAISYNVSRGESFGGSVSSRIANSFGSFSVDSDSTPALKIVLIVALR
jgi:hypothetical protein